MIDIYVIFVSLIAVALGVDAIRLHRRHDDMQRQLEEEQAYNENANGNLRQLRKECVAMDHDLNELTMRYNRLYARHTDITCERLAHNYILIVRNIRKESKSGD